MELTGQRLGRYHLLRLLGFGGMGEVYLANSLGVAGFEKLVTVKVLRRQFSDNPDRVSDLLREAFIGVRLDHENIVQVLDLGEHEGMYFFVMEYVRGFSLREVIAFSAAHSETMALRSAVYAVRCMADALAYVHRVRGPQRKLLGLIHRDVSPSNILLGAEGRTKLSDFGVAGMAQDAVRANAVIGKPRYLPPEAAGGAPATQGWDLYALGVVLHSALTGETDIDRGVMKIGPRLPPVAEVRPDCPGPIADLVDRATARDPADRIPDATTFRDMLDSALPRQSDDAEHWRAFIQGMYRRDAFVARYGTLPYVEDLLPELLQADAVSPPSVAYVETVVVDAQRPLKLGLSPAHGVERARTQGDRVATWLRRRLRCDVRVVVASDYRALADALGDGEVDFAWMPPVTFLLAAERGAGVVALAQRYGRPTYNSAIVVRADSVIQCLADLDGRTMAFVDRESASGYVYGADLIAREVGEPSKVLREQHFQGSHRAVCESVLRGWVDAGTTYLVRDQANTFVHAGWIDLCANEQDQFRVLAITDPIPGDAMCHRPGLATGIIERIARAMIDVADDPEGVAVLEEVFHTTGMVRADLRIYDPVRETLQRLSKLPRI